MKFGVLWLCFGLVLTLGAQSLERYIPVEASMVVKLRPRQIAALPVLQGKSLAPEWRNIREQIEKFNLTGGGLPSRALLVFSEKYQTAAMLAPTTYTPQQLGEQLEKVAASHPEIQVAKSSRQDYEGYIVTIADQQQTRRILVYYLEPGIIVALFDNSIPLEDFKPSQVPNELGALVSGGSADELVRLVSAVSRTNGTLRLTAPALQRIVASATCPGGKSDQLRLHGDLWFEKPENAAQTMPIIQMAATLGIMNFFGNDQALADDAAKVIKFGVSGRKATIDVLLTDALMTRIKNYVANTPSALNPSKNER